VTRKTLIFSEVQEPGRQGTIVILRIGSKTL